MASSGRKIIRGILGLLDEGVPNVARTEPHLPEGFKITPKDSAGVSLDSNPVLRMYHGTDDPVDFKNFDPSVTRNQGIHLSSSPDVGSHYSGMYSLSDPKGVSLSGAGPRIYPALVDPGRVLDLEGGMPNWWDPDHFRSIGESLQNEDIIKLSMMMDDSGRVGSLLNKIGYDSIKYEHPNPLAGSAPSSTSLMVADPSRIIPEYSLAGRELAKTRGVIAADPALPYELWDDWLKEELANARRR